jgi:hypothetical protein
MECLEAIQGSLAVAGNDSSASKAGGYVIYSPLRGVAFWANKKAADV